MAGDPVSAAARQPGTGAEGGAAGTNSPAPPPPSAGPAPSVRVDAEALIEKGIQLCRKARWRAALDLLRQAVEADPTHATAFYHLGDAYNHTDALAAALEAFETATRLQPDHWRALKGIGIVLDRMHRPHEAAAAYQRARDAQARTAPRLS